MKNKNEFVDYRKLRLSNLNTKEFSHLKLLLYWPLFGLLFMFVERFYKVDSYFAVHCDLDDMISFNEWFLIPYFFWFVYLVFIHIYTLIFDVETFKKLMHYIIITYSVAMLVYFAFPTCQELRPAAFERDNICTAILEHFYKFDTNTNVCPSIHVIGSMAVLFAAWNSKHFSTPIWRVVFAAACVMICLSTMFLKQHSVIDVIAAVPICIAAYPICYSQKKISKEIKHTASV